MSWVYFRKEESYGVGFSFFFFKRLTFRAGQGLLTQSLNVPGWSRVIACAAHGHSLCGPVRSARQGIEHPPCPCATEPSLAEELEITRGFGELGGGVQGSEFSSHFSPFFLSIHPGPLSVINYFTIDLFLRVLSTFYVMCVC